MDNQELFVGVVLRRFLVEDLKQQLKDISAESTIIRVRRAELQEGIANAERERRELEFALMNRLSHREWLKLVGGSVDES